MAVLPLFPLVSCKKTNDLRIILIPPGKTSTTTQSLTSQHAAGGFDLHFYNKTSRT